MKLKIYYYERNVNLVVFDGMFVKNDIISSALQTAMLRNNVINNNIANADVPGFKKSEVRFETYLEQKLNSARSYKDIDISNITPTIHTQNQNFSYRLDGNNVDIEKEMVDLYQNSVKYDALAESVINNYKRLNLVLNGIK